MAASFTIKAKKQSVVLAAESTGFEAVGPADAPKAEAMDEVVDGKTAKEEEELVIASLPNSFNIAGQARLQGVPDEVPASEGAIASAAPAAAAAPEDEDALAARLLMREAALKEQLRENKRMINKSIRELDRERTALQNSEKKLITDIKKAAKDGEL